MKMMFLMPLLMVLLSAGMLLTSCGTPPLEEPDVANAGNPNPKIGEAVTISDWTLTLDKTAVEDGLLKAYFTIDATNSGSGATVRPRSFTAIAGDGKTELDRSIICSSMPANLDPKQKITGTDAAQCFTLNSPDDAKGATIKYTLSDRTVTWKLP